MASATTVRDWRPTDFEFVASSFKKGFRATKLGSRYAGADYWPLVNKWFDSVLTDASTKVRVACFKDDEDVMLGWMLSSVGHPLAYYTKPEWRRCGVFTRLAEATPEAAHMVEHMAKTKAERAERVERYGR